MKLKLIESKTHIDGKVPVSKVVSSCNIHAMRQIHESLSTCVGNTLRDVRTIRTKNCY